MFFTGFRGNPIRENIIWQESTTGTGFPFTCSQCGKNFPPYTRRWIGNSVTRPGHYGCGVVLCDDCKSARVHVPKPVYARERESLD